MMKTTSMMIFPQITLLTKIYNKWLDIINNLLYSIILSPNNIFLNVLLFTVFHDFRFCGAERVFNSSSRSSSGSRRRMISSRYTLTGECSGRVSVSLSISVVRSLQQDLRPVVIHQLLEDTLPQLLLVLRSAVEFPPVVTLQWELVVKSLQWAEVAMISILKNIEDLSSLFHYILNFEHGIGNVG